MAKKDLIVIEVGPDKEIDEGFEGTIHKVKMKRMAAIKQAQGLQKQMEDDPLDGMISLLENIEAIYPKVDLKYGEHVFKSIEDLFETDVGETLITTVLVPKVAGAVQISKN